MPLSRIHTPCANDLRALLYVLLSTTSTQPSPWRYVTSNSPGGSGIALRLYTHSSSLLMSVSVILHSRSACSIAAIWDWNPSACSMAWIYALSSQTRLINLQSSNCRRQSGSVGYLMDDNHICRVVCKDAARHWTWYRYRCIPNNSSWHTKNHHSLLNDG